MRGVKRIGRDSKHAQCPGCPLVRDAPRRCVESPYLVMSRLLFLRFLWRGDSGAWISAWDLLISLFFFFASDGGGVARSMRMGAVWSTFFFVGDSLLLP